jgi:hypothetical protein
MNKKIVIILSFSILYLHNYVRGQVALGESIGIRIMSESKEIFKEKDMLKQKADEVYFAQLEVIKGKVTEQIKKSIKSLTDQNARAELIEPSVYTSLTFFEKNGKIFGNYNMSHSQIHFKVTTPDIAFGIGVGKYNDPSIRISYDVNGSFELVQSGTVESIKFMNPKWNVEITHYSGYNLQVLSIDKLDLEIWAEAMLGTSLMPAYLGLNEISNLLNTYLTTAVKNNPVLLKELELDGNNQMIVKLDDEQKNLLFVHNYSKAGMVKRTNSQNASDITKPTNASVVTQVPTTTSASSILKPSAVSGSKSKLNSTIRKN